LTEPITLPFLLVLQAIVFLKLDTSQQLITVSSSFIPARCGSLSFFSWPCSVCLLWPKHPCVHQSHHRQPFPMAAQ
jgi:hypothetical protein